MTVTLLRGGADPASWFGQLQLDAKGRICRSSHNLVHILRHDPRWAHSLHMNALTRSLELVNAPWDEIEYRGKVPDMYVAVDVDMFRLVCWLERVYKVSWSKTDVADAAVSAAPSYHPVADWLRRLVWDGEPRVATWLVKYCQSMNTAFTAAVGRAWLISAVARAMVPGCQVDMAIVFEGAQGCGKSSLLRLLGGQWYNGSHIDMSGKDGLISAGGSWIIELAELASMRRGEVETTKAYISTCTDRYRPPFGRMEVLVPRSCVFAGTTNAGEYLDDPTGARRFAPVPVGNIDLTLPVEQLWAEAVVLWRAGVPWHLDRAEAAEQERQNLERNFGDPWDELIGMALRQTNEAGMHCSGAALTGAWIMEHILKIEPGRHSRSDLLRIGAVVRRMGGKSFRRHGAAGKVYYPGHLVRIGHVSP